MFKSLIFTFLLVLTLNATAKVEVRWLGVAGLILEDDSTKIMFDPMLTRSNWKHWLMLSKFKSDPVLIKSVVDELKLFDLKAIFVSHSHFDHAVDAPMFSKYTEANFYADDSTEIIAKAYNDNEIKTQKISESVGIQIGKFKITPIKRDHSKIHLLGMDWLPGAVPTNFDFSFYDYRLGDTWMYLIEHPEGTILIDQGSNPRLDLITKYTKHIDVLIQGIANREDNEKFIRGYVTVYRPKVFMPLHFDNFFSDFSKEMFSELPGVKFNSLLEDLKVDHSEMKVISPKIFERNQIL